MGYIFGMFNLSLSSKPVMQKISRENNFDLIRLFAALSVVASHMAQHGIVTNQATINCIAMLWYAFPGVQIFFIVSGFLITNS